MKVKTVETPESLKILVLTHIDLLIVLYRIPDGRMVPVQSDFQKVGSHVEGVCVCEMWWLCSSAGSEFCPGDCEPTSSLSAATVTIAKFQFVMKCKNNEEINGMLTWTACAVSIWPLTFMPFLFVLRTWTPLCGVYKPHLFCHLGIVITWQSHDLQTAFSKYSLFLFPHCNVKPFPDLSLWTAESQTRLFSGWRTLFGCVGFVVGVLSLFVRFCTELLMVQFQNTRLSWRKWIGSWAFSSPYPRGFV